MEKKEKGKNRKKNGMALGKRVIKKKTETGNENARKRKKARGNVGKNETKKIEKKGMEINV